MENYNKTELKMLFSNKLTENGDTAFNTTGNKLLDILFMSEYYTKHLKETPQIGDGNGEKLFAMFIRDGRFGLGRRDLGRQLMRMANCSAEQVVKAGRFDDLFLSGTTKDEWINYLFNEVHKGNELAKKWMPRYSSKHIMIARKFAKMLDLNKQQYGKLIKGHTVENQMSRQNWQDIDFEHVPSLAAIKYAKAFERHESERYHQYLADVKAGKKELHVATTTVYDIYKNRRNIDADLFYSKIEKISGNWIPIIDVSGSMYDSNDSIGKALSIGKYLSDCSTYCPKQFLTFSNRPQLVEQKRASYNSILDNIARADWSGSTNFSAVMSLLNGLKREIPQYLIVLSDMEFNCGSASKKDETMQYFKERGYSTKIIWWNFNSRNTTCPETDSYGNIFISGYNPMLLKYLEVGFDGKQFLNKLLREYAKNIGYTL